MPRATIPRQDGPVQPRFQIFWANGAYRWRLLGANNRECGRSAYGFAHPALARQDAEALRELVGSGTVEADLASLRGTQWTWRLSVRATTRAESVRRYGRRTECERGLARFLLLAAQAPVSQAVLVGHHLTHSTRL